MNDSVRRLKRIILYCSGDEISCEVLVQLLALLNFFLKYQHDAHIGHEGECPSHSIMHLLSKNAVTSLKEHLVECTGCRFPFWAISKKCNFRPLSGRNHASSEGL